MSEPKSDPSLGQSPEATTSDAASGAPMPNGETRSLPEEVEIQAATRGLQPADTLAADAAVPPPGHSLAPSQTSLQAGLSRLPFRGPPAWLLACLLVYTAIWTLIQGFTSPGLPFHVLQDFATAQLAERPPGLQQALLLGWFTVMPNQAFFYHLLIQSLMALTGLFVWLISRQLHGNAAAYIALFSLVFLPIISLTGAPELDSIVVLLPLWFGAIYALLAICTSSPHWTTRSVAYGLLALAGFLMSLVNNALLVLMVSYLIWLAASGLLFVAIRAGRFTAARRALFARVLGAKVGLPLALMGLVWYFASTARQAWFDEGAFTHLMTGGHFRALSVVLVSFGTLAVGAFLFRLRFRFRQRLWFEHPRLERTFAFNMLLLSGVLALASWFVPALYGFVWGSVQPLERLAALVYVGLPPFLLFWSTNLPQGAVPLRRAGTALGAVLGFALAVGTANLLLPTPLKNTSEPWERIGKALTLATQRADRPTPSFLLLDPSLAAGAAFFYEGSSRLVTLRDNANYSAINGDNAMAVCRNGAPTCALAIKILGSDRLLESLIAKLSDPKAPERRAELMVLWPLPIDGYEGLQAKPKNPLSLLPAPKKDDGQTLPPGLTLPQLKQ